MATKRKKTTKRAATKKKTTKRKAARATKKKGSKRKVNAAFMKPLTPSATLADIVGSRPLPRTQVVKKLWVYIKRHGLQDSRNRRMINADAKLRKLFGTGQVSMFDLAKILKRHLR